MQIISVPSHAIVLADIADLITRTKGLDDTHDDIALVDGQTDYVDTVYKTSNIALYFTSVVVSISQTSYTKLREIRFLGVTSRMRIYLWARDTSDGYETTSRIYINGSASGTERIPTADYPDYSMWYEDRLVTPGDLIQIYCKKDAGASGDGDTSAFKVSGDIETLSFVEVAV